MGLSAVDAGDLGAEVIVLKVGAVADGFGNESHPVRSLATVDGNRSDVGVGVDAEEGFHLAVLVGLMFSFITGRAHEFAFVALVGLVGVVDAPQNALTLAGVDIFCKHSLFFIDSSLTAEYWHGILCYEKSEVEGKETFPLTEDGRMAMKAWLEAQV